MLNNDLYERCLPILQDGALDDDDRTEKLEAFVRTEASLTGKELENAVLDALWRYRAATSDDPSAVHPPSRHAVIRHATPAAWQVARTPTPSHAATSTKSLALPSSSSGFFRSKSSSVSPFVSPRPSPRLSFVSPYIPHSPRLDAYQPNSEASPTQDLYGDLGNESVEWLVGDDAGSNASSLPGEASMGNSAQDLSSHLFMDPYDILRSIFGDELSNDALKSALEENGYDIASTMNMLMEAHGLHDQSNPTSSNDAGRTVLVGKSMSPNARPATPVGQQKSNVVCRYWLASGSCARADCRFLHDTSGTVCKYAGSQTNHCCGII
jgi:hypothetical protein